MVCLYVECHYAECRGAIFLFLLIDALKFIIYSMKIDDLSNRTAHFKNVNNYLKTKIYSYLEKSGGQSSNLYLNVAHFFNARVH
jgi:hypothetical protein